MGFGLRAVRDGHRRRHGAPPAFAPFERYAVGSWPEAVAIADVTGDGRDDVVMTTSFYFDPENDYRLYVFRQRRDGGLLGSPRKLATRGAEGDRMGVAAGDLDGDRRADVAVATSAGVELFLQGADGLAPGRLIPGSQGAQYVAIADMDGDGRKDVVSLGAGGPRLLMNTRGGFLASQIGTTSSNRALAVGDVDGDGHLDVVHAPWNGPWNVTVFSRREGDRPGDWAGRFVPTGSEYLSFGLDVGDVTGDGRADVVVTEAANWPRSHLRVLAQGPAGTLGPPTVLPSYDIPEAVRVHDLDGDGRRDVVVLHGGWSRAGVYRQALDGTLGEESLIRIPYASHYHSQGLAVGDVDSDGRPDLAIADYNNGLVMLRQTDPPAPSPEPPGPGPAGPSAPDAGGSQASPEPRGPAVPPAGETPAAGAPPAPSARVPLAPPPPEPAPVGIPAESREPASGPGRAGPRRIALVAARMRPSPFGVRLELVWRGGSGRVLWTLRLAARGADGRPLRKRVRGAGNPGPRTVRRLVALGPGWRGARLHGMLRLTDGERSVERALRGAVPRARPAGAAARSARGRCAG